MAINAFSLWGTWKSLEVGEAALHTYGIRNTFQTLLNLVHDAVNSQRNYLTMREEQFLIPYHKSVNDIQEKISHLKVLTGDKPWYQERLQALEQRIDKEMAFLKKGVELTNAGEAKAVKKLVESGEGLTILDSIRRLISQTDTEEVDHLLLTQQWGQSKTSNQWVLFTSSSGTVVVFTLFLM